VPILTSHTVLSANGTDCVESVTIAQVDEKFQALPGTEKSYACDSLLIAVGLDPVNEFYLKALQFGLPAFAAGDAEEIAEASAAIFSGKIKGYEIAQFLGKPVDTVPAEWIQTAEILKSKPGKISPQEFIEFGDGVGPVIHCLQEIPCNPCSAICPKHLISIDSGDIRKIPQFSTDLEACKGCMQCVLNCPGLAITMVDYRRNSDNPIVSIPLEFSSDVVKTGDIINVLDINGSPLGSLPVFQIATLTNSGGTRLVRVQAPKEYARQISGIQIQDELATQPLDHYVAHVADDVIVCRCERVTAGEIRALIHEGYRDMNEIKAMTRAGMGACGSKTCAALIQRLFREEGIPSCEVVELTRRPMFVEVPLGIFAGESTSE
jgi:sarcosine oxidase, subunit alpha